MKVKPITTVLAKEGVFFIWLNENRCVQESQNN